MALNALPSAFEPMVWPSEEIESLVDMSPAAPAPRAAVLLPLPAVRWSPGPVRQKPTLCAGGSYKVRPSCGDPLILFGLTACLSPRHERVLPSRGPCLAGGTCAQGISHGACLRSNPRFPRHGLSSFPKEVTMAPPSRCSSGAETGASPLCKLHHDFCDARDGCSGEGIA